MANQLKRLGLIGKPLSHSFSKSYFTEKFQQLGTTDYEYELYELEAVNELPGLVKSIPELVGLNVTIPFKKDVLRYLDELSPEAQEIGAVNTIKIQHNKLVGFNTDYYGFKTSLFNWLPANWKGNALVLGTGGASLAVQATLKHNRIPFQMISRRPGPGFITYQQLKDENHLATHQLVINTTPLGMEPNINTYPDLDYAKIGSRHYMFDLVYNPLTTSFMKSGLSQGAQAKNGLEMLQLQAEKAWDIWTK